MIHHHSLRIIAAALIVAMNAPSTLALSTAFTPPMAKESNIFVPFLKRYVRMPGSWTAELLNDTTMRFVGPTVGGVTSAFTIGQLPRNTCAILKLRERLTQKYGPSPDKEWKIGRESVAGLAGSAVQWEEKPASGAERHWCVVPPGIVLTSEVSTLASDTESILVIRGHVLKYLAQEERKSRPTRMLTEEETKRVPTPRNRPVRRTLRSSIKSWASKVQK